MHSVYGAHTRSIIPIGGETSYCEAPHALASVQTRSLVVVGGVDSNSSIAHVVHGVHADWFALPV